MCIDILLKHTHTHQVTAVFGHVAISFCVNVNDLVNYWIKSGEILIISVQNLKLLVANFETHWITEKKGCATSRQWCESEHTHFGDRSKCNKLSERLFKLFVCICIETVSFFICCFRSFCFGAFSWVFWMPILIFFWIVVVFKSFDVKNICWSNGSLLILHI